MRVSSTSRASCRSRPAPRGPGRRGRRSSCAGAAVVDVSPRTLPVIVNGGFLEAKADTIHDPLSARALVLDDGATRLAIVVVDSCGLPRELVDVAKERAERDDGHPDRSDAGLGHAHALGPLGDRRPRQSRGPRVRQAPARLDRRGDREGRREPDPGPGRMGVGRRLRAHPLPALDLSARQDAHRPVRLADGPRQHAPGLPEPGHGRAGGAGRSRAVRPVGPGARRPADRAAGQLLDALLRRPGGLGRLLRQVRPG